MSAYVGEDLIQIGLLFQAGLDLENSTNLFEVAGLLFTLELSLCFNDFLWSKYNTFKLLLIEHIC